MEPIDEAARQMERLRDQLGLWEEPAAEVLQCAVVMIRMFQSTMAKHRELFIMGKSDGASDGSHETRQTV